MQDQLLSGIYCIENKITHKKYIGQSVNINARFSKHRSELNCKTHFNDYLQKAWNKYGEESFDFYVIEYCELDKLDEKEIYYINHFETINRDKGYNLKSGGQENCKLSKESKRKISESNKKYYSSHPEAIEKSRENALKQWANHEIKKKICGENNGMYGKHHTEESRKKISETRIGKEIKKRYPNNVKCIELNKIFNNSIHAGKELSLDSSAILKVCRGERKTCGGYHWEFVNNME